MCGLGLGLREALVGQYSVPPPPGDPFQTGALMTVAECPVHPEGLSHGAWPGSSCHNCTASP